MHPLTQIWNHLYDNFILYTMKKNILLFVFTLLFGILYAQIFTISPTNPIPRVGDRISLSYTIDMEAKLDSTKSNSINSGGTIQNINKNILRGNLEINQKFENTGDVKIGPIIIGINGKQYKSDSITLKVLPTLPNVDEGFWIQFVQIKKSFYIVTDQIFSIDTESTHSGSQNMIKPVQELSANLVSKSVKIKGIKDIVLASTSSIKTKKQNNNNSKSRCICTKVYKVTLDDSYKNDGELTKLNFEKLPEELNFQPVKIKFN